MAAYNLTYYQKRPKKVTFTQENDMVRIKELELLKEKNLDELFSFFNQHKKKSTIEKVICLFAFLGRDVSILEVQAENMEAIIRSFQGSIRPSTAEFYDLNLYLNRFLNWR